MEIPKDEIIKMLGARGDDANSQQAEQELPDQVDPEKHGDLLSKFGLDPKELITKFAGGQLGGLGGKLGL